MSQLLTEDYEYLSQVVRGGSGLVLGDDQQYLVVNRLQPILPRLGALTLSALVRDLRERRDPTKIRLVCEALATHESLFFRDTIPFTCLIQSVLPRLTRLPRYDGKVRIWSAACSFGQEPFSILFACEDAPQSLNGHRVEIVATDFSRYAITRAREATFTSFEVRRGLNPEQLQRYFDAAGPNWQVKERYRSQVQFSELNFLDSFHSLGPVDVVFCRNVLIYFDEARRRDVLERMYEVLTPDGVIILGSAESVMGITPLFQRDEGSNCSAFRKATSP